jgi:hypothetical protein
MARLQAYMNMKDFSLITASLPENIRSSKKKKLKKRVSPFFHPPHWASHQSATTTRQSSISIFTLPSCSFVSVVPVVVNLLLRACSCGFVENLFPAPPDFDIQPLPRAVTLLDDQTISLSDYKTTQLPNQVMMKEYSFLVPQVRISA